MNAKHVANVLIIAIAGSLVSETAMAQRKVPVSAQTGAETKRAPSFDSTQSPSRMVFLNGVNIGNVRGQELQNVSIRIDDAGNINIIAPQYDVSRESSYHPLLPAELPRFPKSQAQFPGIPEGRYSKDAGNDAPMSASTRPTQIDEGRAPTPSAGVTAQTEPKQSRTELKATGEAEGTTAYSQQATPVAAPKNSTIPPVAAPDIPSEARGESM